MADDLQNKIEELSLAFMNAVSRVILERMQYVILEYLKESETQTVSNPFAALEESSFVGNTGNSGQLLEEADSVNHVSIAKKKKTSASAKPKRPMTEAQRNALIKATQVSAERRRAKSP